MNENIENLVLEHLRHIRSKVDKIELDVSELKWRMTSLEGSMAASFGTDVRQQFALDKLSVRVDRIERRLDLTGAGDEQPKP